MRRFEKQIIGLCIVGSMIVASCLSASANKVTSEYDPVPDDSYNVKAIQAEASSSNPFNEDKVNELVKRANTQTVYPDKNSDGSMGTASTRGSGTYPTRYGVILVTADPYKGLIPTGHAAIIWTANTVVESLANGVTTGPNNWNSTKNTCYGVTTYGTTADQDDKCSYYAYNRIGKPYNWNYLDRWTRNRFYCSQLVYAAYKDLYNIDLDTIAFGPAVHPMELVNSNNTYTIYQK